MLLLLPQKQLKFDRAAATAGDSGDDSSSYGGNGDVDEVTEWLVDEGPRKKQCTEEEDGLLGVEMTTRPADCGGYDRDSQAVNLGGGSNISAFRGEEKESSSISAASPTSNAAGVDSTPTAMRKRA